MFYSQFILAKKGPLGTIWIAAHLERKLRKNQVADTDIGVSVDSILFPEVPIALRLSSHLLLGVVRIYSRKVNYLFHDCSEALLKIKQAFRATAVDLPPEESTAPYHSITLPETFDLDDFELPDNAFFHGNYVDHHVSAREQITLQDTMEGMVYSTSQFGLDERFGDGDASQIGLDLDEDLFLEKASSGPSLAPLGMEENVDPDSSSQPLTFTEMDIDGVETSKDQPKLLAGGFEIDSDILESKGADDSSRLVDDRIQTSDLNGILPSEPIEGPFGDPVIMDFAFNAAEVPSSDLNECAHAPSTPGLMSEAVPSLNLSRKTSVHNAVECVIGKPSLEFVTSDSTKLMPEENLGDPVNELCCHIDGTNSGKKCETDIHPAQNMESECPCGSQQDVQIKLPEYGPSPPVGLISSDIIQSAASPTSVLSEPKSVSLAPECSGMHIVEPDELSLKCVKDGAETLENGSVCIPSIYQTHNDAEAVEMEHQEDLLDVTTLSPRCSLEASTLQASHNKPPDGHVSSEIALAIESAENDQHNNSFGPEALTKLGPVDAVEDSSPPSSASPSNANFGLGLTDKQEINNPCDRVNLRACSSSSKPNALPLDGGVFVENDPDLSPMEVGLHAMEAQETVAQHVDVASSEVQVQGENCCLPDAADRELGLKQMQEPLSSEIRGEFNKSYECLDDVTSNDNQLGALHYSGIPEIPAPETLLLAPTEPSDLLNDLLMQSTAGEPVTSEGTVDRFGNLSGKKRRLMESTPVLENGNSSKFSRMLRSRSTMDYIPDDDDVLASILVGKKPPVLKMRPTPPPDEVVLSKRPRLTPRVNVLKRKVLLDDDMILHADVIRKQLTNTEDIRRMRRKAPCTRKETWMIHKYISEEEIFSEPLLTGMSAVLTGLQNQTYHPTDTDVNPSVAKESHLEEVEELGFSKREELIKQTTVERVDGSIAAMPDKNTSAASEPTETLTQVENHISERSLLSDNENQTEVSVELEMPNKGANDVVNHAAAIGVEMPILSDPLPGDGCNVSADVLRIETTLMDKNDGMQTTPQKDDGSCLIPHEKLVIEPTDDLRDVNGERLHLMENSSIEKDASIPDTADDATRTFDVDNDTSILDNCIERDESVVDETKCSISDDAVPKILPQNQNDGVEEVPNDEILIPLPDNCSVETRPDLLTDSLTTNMNPFVPDVAMEINGLTAIAIVTDDNNTGGVSTSEVGNAVEGGVVVKEMINNEGHLSSSPFWVEGTQIDSSYPLQLNPDMENGTSNGEGPGCQGHLESAISMEMPTAVISIEGDSGDFCHLMDENDTDFLNADDEAELMEEDDNIPTGEEDRSIENSGWSTRTRAVARYLRSLFDNETGRGVKMVHMDNLLIGKTRKEASRMFFETLVLKTKDYVHVEQENPFEKINIQPRVKIMKSEI
ncbi:Rad21/Rec8-like protein [Cinnamomum micranthum f. kanehirae]|uniref:Rad21/Rec8-like protein n=1 Tax=Cinnamomum micranthum f. kanehirae TaxID=337451 RepID=A0A3S3QG28_9MAGN|nr:Rad21/Rec8-like protein [Cinnamomum micranthum f. kanehirae]